MNLKNYLKKAGKIGIVIIFFLFFTIPAQALTRVEIQTKIAQILAQIRQLQILLDQLRAQERISKGFCGDNIIQAPEICDGTSLNNQTCQSKGYELGKLRCSGNCMQFDASNCWHLSGGGSIPAPIPAPAVPVPTPTPSIPIPTPTPAPALVPPPIPTGRVIYVDKDNKFGNGCNNNWEGTIQQPKCNLDAAWFQSGLEPGDTVILREASNYRNIRLLGSSSGTANAPVLIKPYEGEKIILSGGVQFGIRLDSDSQGDPSYITIQGPIEIYGYEYSYAIGTQANRNYGLKLTDCDIHNVQQGPRWFNVLDSEIKNCNVHDISVNGVQFRGAQNILIENVNVWNVSDNRGPDDSDADGFHTYGGENLVFKNCSSHNQAEDGFDLNANATLINCRSYDNHGAGLKVWRRIQDNYLEKTVTAINSLFYNNGYYAPDPRQGNPGIKVSYESGLNLYNCVVDHNYDFGIQINNNSATSGASQMPIKIYNSIISNSINGAGIMNYHAADAVSSDYNLYFSNYGSDVNGLNAESHSLFGQNMLFNSDYSLANGSPAIDRGTNLSSANFNYDILNVNRPIGSAWDIGAYEKIKYEFKKLFKESRENWE